MKKKRRMEMKPLLSHENRKHTRKGREKRRQLPRLKKSPLSFTPLLIEEEK